MGAGRDTLRQFVVWLEVHLDDPSVPVPDAASDLAVSRAVLDRFVTSAGGEAPASLRRRILLERAAHELRTTRSSVLAVALTAGYNSSEAFTRAFARAFGAAPSRWRTSTSSFRLPSPNGVHFHPPAGIRFPARGGTHMMDFTTEFFEHYVRYLGVLVDRAERLDPGAIDEPITVSVPSIDDAPTIRSLLSRLIGQLQMWGSAMDGSSYDFDVEHDETIASMRARLAQVGPSFVASVRDISDRGAYEEMFLDTTCEQPLSFTAAGMLGHILTYGSYRRTLVTAAIEAASHEGLADDPLEWFAP